MTERKPKGQTVQDGQIVRRSRIPEPDEGENLLRDGKQSVISKRWTFCPSQGRIPERDHAGTICPLERSVNHSEQMDILSKQEAAEMDKKSSKVL